MANNKLYENYLMHYRTKGSKNGYTKYPGKYTPIGEKAMAPLASITESHKIKYPEPLEKPTLNSVFNGITKGATSTSQRQREAEARRIAGGSQGTITRAEAARRANQQAAEQRRITGGSTGMARTINAKPLLSGTQAVGMRGVGAYNNVNKKYPFDAEAYARRQESIKDLNRNAAEQRRIAGGNVGGGTTAVQRMIKSQEDMHNVTSKLYNAANAIANPHARSQESQQFTNQKMAEARRIKGGSGISASQRQKEAEARRIAGGTQGTITTAESKRKNINDWYSGQVRGGNQSAAEARRIKGGTQGVTTTAQAAAKNAESERKKKKLKGVLKALLKSKSHGISRFF